MAEQDRDFDAFAMDEHGYGDEPGYDPRGEAGNRGPIILTLAGGVLVVFGAVVWNTYANGIRGDGASVPVILAEEGGYKTAVSEPGGMVQPDQTHRVYDQLATLPEDLEPIPAAGDREDEVLVGGARDLRPSLSDTDLAGGGVPDPLETPSGVDTTELAALGPVEPDPDARAGASQEVAVVAEDAPGPLPDPVPPQPETRFAFDDSGAFLVQLAALRSEDGARDAWLRMSAAQPDVFEGATRFIQRADLGAKGVFFRLRSGPFSDRAEARAFCDAIHAGGGACIVVER